MYGLPEIKTGQSTSLIKSDICSQPESWSTIQVLQSMSLSLPEL